jgi:phenylpropionate dioxygenase-like ring-hydroxylating dioxygenase large terminal subunit
MGQLLRRYWIPALLSEDIPEPGCPQVRVRLLGEDLVAFRDSEGRVGLLGERCSHRRTSLFYARNEECGLRCIYHGWKYDVDGNILETPAEPANSMIKHHVKHPSYPCREVNGMIYAYMGPKDRMPLLPDVPWMTLSADHVQVRHKCINECNWLQTLEGNIDSVHTPFLHARGGRSSQPWRSQNNPPAFEVEPTRWGIRAVVRYPAENGAAFIRTNTFLMPVYAALPNGASVDGKLDGFQVNVEVPRDDYTTMRYTIQVQRELELNGTARWSSESQDVGPDGRKLRNFANDYLIARAKQRSGEVFSGLDASFLVQDGCAVESMGSISDREHEHLGITDTQIAAVRRLLLDAALNAQEGVDPPGVAYAAADNDFRDFYMVSAVVAGDRDWKAAVPDVTTQVLMGTC